MLPNCELALLLTQPFCFPLVVLSQNGKRTAFALLETCKQLAGDSAGRLLLGLHEPVLAVEPRGHGAGVDVITQKRRWAVLQLPARLLLALRTLLGSITHRDRR